MRSALSRSALLGELRVKKVIDLVPEEVRQIHGLLEADFNPLQLCKQLAPLIEKLSSLDAPLSAASPVHEAPLAQYQQALRQVCHHRCCVLGSLCSTGITGYTHDWTADQHNQLSQWPVCYALPSRAASTFEGSKLAQQHLVSRLHACTVLSACLDSTLYREPLTKAPPLLIEL